MDFGAVLRELGTPHYLKLDVEGMELVCLDVLRHFEEKPDYVSLESVQTRFADTRKEIELLSEPGYDAFQVIDQEDVATLQSPPIPAQEGEYADVHFERGATGLFGAELTGRWCSKAETLRRYRALRLGSKVTNRVTRNSGVPGMWRLEPLVHSTLRLVTDAAGSGWYDTHARHSSVRV